MTVNSENFDLALWKLCLPIDQNGTTDGVAYEILELEGFEHTSYFYTGEDGAMVFHAPTVGAVSKGTTAARSELREMEADGSLAAWSLSEGGTMTATLKIDEAPLMSDGSAGRIVIGQIHGSDEELVRLYWDDGKVYFKSDIGNDSNASTTYQLTDDDGTTPNVSLGEPFSYLIKVKGDKVTVDVYADGKTYTATLEVGSEWANDQFYFKAGAYLGSNETNSTGAGQVSFYGLDFGHGSDAGLDGLLDDITGNAHDNSYSVDTTGTSGADILKGGTRDDVIYGYGGADKIWAGAGDDRIVGGTGADTLRGEDGDDTIWAGAGNDKVVGGAGADTITGDDGQDTVYGGDGNDVIKGGDGDDILKGEAGDDALKGEAGDDKIYGGGGADDLRGGDGNDQISGEDGNDALYGQAGDDKLSGSAGNDYLSGGDGTDAVYGGDGNDTASGGNGDDTLKGEAGNDTLSGDSGKDKLYGGDGADSLKGGDDDDFLDGGNGIDRLDGGSGNDSLYGYAEADRLYGQDGNDKLVGGDGDDTLYGGAGDDFLYADAGADNLYGGTGTDTFIFTSLDSSTLTTSGRDDIYEFSQDEDDLLNLSALDANSKTDGNQTFSFIGTQGFSGRAGELRFVNSSSETYVYGDTDGDGSADFSFHIDGVITLVNSDFIL
ncbi:Ca2+-binding RTX toxin-like protein [Peteryoungia aggregata LMG 23059]|uniref:Ca2+-binding RTX toxin-like protein n=1 Tax=Peteryoungia aggregata LMG 23059 TaxID=1368425 RepID=A0ABU0GAK6_9HYPH|nr:polysaccharide lyase family 7 protein [Peteryoungia aggregata]MDQ0422384.1 Ca2+-binding RTX toxin-like protein [Peteryoungia aggregata LMG 23059]